MVPGLVVILWDRVYLDPSGQLVSDASFVRVLEELRSQVPLLLVCCGSGASVEARNLRIVFLNFVPTLAKWLRNPSAFSRAITRAVEQQLPLIRPDTPVLLVDISLANCIAMEALRSRRAFVYVRGDDVREVWIRQRGFMRVAGALYALFLASIRRRMLARLPIIGAGAEPLATHLLGGRPIWPFYPSSLIRSEIDAVIRSATAHGANRNPIRIVWVGRMTAIKRVDRLIRAAAQFARSWTTRVELHLFGDGPLRPQLEKLAARTGSPLRTVFHGRVPSRSIIERLDGALCLCLTSAWEGFPKVIPEALSAGVPIVSFDIGSVSSLIEKRNVGVVVRQGESGLEKAFALLAGSADAWLTRSLNARAAALDLALDNQCRLLLEHLRTCSA